MSYSPLSVRPGSSSASTRYHPYAPVPTRISTASPSQSSRGSSDMILPPMHGPSRTSTPAFGMRTDTPQFRDDLPLDHSGFSFPRSDSHPGYGQYPDTGPVGHQLWDEDFPPHRNSSQSGYGASLPLQSLRAGDVDRIAGRHGLKPELVNRLHAFSQSSQQVQNSELYALLLQRQDEAADMRTAVTTLGKKIDELKQAYVSSFTPVPSAAKNMRDITRHYITQPLRNYSHLNIKTKGYYDTKPQSLKAPLYPADPNVREVILAHLKEYADTVRSGFRKNIWTFTLNRMTLDQCAAYLIKHYVYKSQSEQFTTQSKARIALMRRVAKPLVRKKFAKGQDTGFWPNLAAELEKLYGLHGEDTNSPGWEQWATKIIEEDEAEYTDGSTSMPPPPEDLPA